MVLRLHSLVDFPRDIPHVTDPPQSPVHKGLRVDMRSRTSLRQSPCRSLASLAAIPVTSLPTASPLVNGPCLVSVTDSVSPLAPMLYEGLSFETRTAVYLSYPCLSLPLSSTYPHPSRQPLSPTSRNFHYLIHPFCCFTIISSRFLP